MTAYRSCCLIIEGLQSLCAKHLPATQRMTNFFASAFSSCVVLSCMIYNSPACPLTKSALDVLDIGVSLFTKQASKATHCPLTAELLTTMQFRNHEGYENYIAYTQGENPSYKLPDHSNPQCNFMRVLEGFTTVINSQKPSDSSSNGSSPREHSPPSPGEQDLMFDGPVVVNNSNVQPMQGTSDHYQQQEAFEYSTVNGSQGHMHEEYYGNYGVPPPMYNASPNQFVRPAVDLLTAAGLPSTAQAGPFALPQSFPIPQAPHMQNIITQPFHQGAADLSMDLPPSNDAAAWDKIFQGYGGRLA